jgi:hypothetical protein
MKKVMIVSLAFGAALVALIEPMAKDAGAADPKQDFEEVAKVLLSPRCRNCHPVGDAPLNTDAGKAHAMNVSRKSAASGLPCTTCHRAQNAQGEHAPPGAENWHMPPSEAPMPFEGKTPSELCAQLKDPTKTNGRSVAALVDHVDKDGLVLWAWSPGEGRATPPGTHADLVRHMKAWVDGGAPCP